MRPIAVPFVVAPPSGARVRTRLRLGGADERVLRAVGGHLGRLAGAAVAVRCRPGGGDDRRADRKRALTAAASSRWAGRSPARRMISGAARMPTCAMPGWAAPREQSDPVAASGSGWRAPPPGPRVCHGGGAVRQAGPPAAPRGPARCGRAAACRGSGVGVPGWPAARQAPPCPRPCRRRADQAGMAGALGGGTAVGHCRWRSRQRWGNETIRVHPDEGWLELRLPAPLAALSNTPGRAATTGCRARWCSPTVLPSGRRR